MCCIKHNKVILTPMDIKQKELKHSPKSHRPKNQEFTYDEDCFDPAEMKKIFRNLGKIYT